MGTTSRIITGIYSALLITLLSHTASSQCNPPSPPCENGGTCLNNACKCLSTYQGMRCENSVTSTCVDSTQCNGGNCIDTVCVCVGDFWGPNCENTIAVVRFERTSVNFKEGDGNIDVDVRRENGMNLNFANDAVVTDTLTGTATPGVDYSFIPVSKMESFNPGQDRRMFELQILNDDLIENEETIVLKLSVMDEMRARVDATGDTMTVTINRSDQPDPNNPCAPNPCLNGGLCSEPIPGQFLCQCPDGYTGTQCELDAPVGCYATGSECQNDGTCGADGVCQCPDEYRGTSCEVKRPLLKFRDIVKTVTEGDVCQLYVDRSENLNGIVEISIAASPIGETQEGVDYIFSPNPMQFNISTGVGSQLIQFQTINDNINNEMLESVQLQLTGQGLIDSAANVVVVTITDGQGGGGQGGGLSSAASISIAAIVAVVILVIAILLIVFYCKRRGKSLNRQASHTSTTQDNSYFSYKPNGRRKKQGTVYEKSERKIGGEFPREKLKLHEHLGSGAFANVVRAEAMGIVKRGHQTVVAVKMLKDTATESDRSDFNKELKVYRLLEPHPNIIVMLGCCTTRDPMYLIIEYAPHGNLQSHLRGIRNGPSQDPYMNADGAASSEAAQRAHFLTPTEVMNFACEVANGMMYLASKQCIHRDLATRNVLLGDGLVCKLSDFGLARDITEQNSYEMQSRGRVPVRWMAPESLLENSYTSKSDVWSFAVLMWELVTVGSHPYPGMSSKRVIEELQKGYRLPKPEHCSEEIYSLMMECWQERPDKRPSFTEVHRKIENMLEDAQGYLVMTEFKSDNYVYLDPDQDSESSAENPEHNGGAANSMA